MKKLYVVGAGSSFEDLTIRAYQTLNKSDAIYCDELLYSKIKTHFESSKLIPNEYTKTKTRCLNAINSANSGITTSILGSGDTGIYGISSIIYEEVDKLGLDIEVEVIPGMTSLLSGAAHLGSPLTRDFALVSLSDNFTEEVSLKEKLETLAQTDLILIFYSPCNPTKKNIELAKEILLTFTKDIKCGLVPNGYSGYDNRPLYNSADAPLLMFEAVRKYLDYTKDYNFVKEHLYTKLKSKIPIKPQLIAPIITKLYAIHFNTFIKIISIIILYTIKIHLTLKYRCIQLLYIKFI